MQKNHNEPEMPSSVFVALVGRPNVGKSSLTNHLVGEKVAIVTQKAQTTRNRITGIITKGPVQYVLLDTPGIHKPRNRLDSRMTQTAAASLKDVDVTLMLFEPTGEFTESELGMVEALRKAGPAIAVINKVDLLNDFAALEARKKQVEEFGIFDAIVTVSAKDGTGCEELFPLLKQYANPGPHYFDDDAFTDMPEKELVAELVREKTKETGSKVRDLTYQINRLAQENVELRSKVDVSELMKILKNGTVIAEKLTSKEWDKIFNLANCLHADLLVKLKEEHNQLTKHDIELLAFILLGFTSKELMVVFDSKDIRTIFKAKSRLKERLRLKKEESLNEFLQKMQES